MTFRSSSSHNSSMGFMSADCSGLDMSRTMWYLSLLWNVALTEFTSVLWVTILHQYRSLTHKLRSRWNRVLLQYVIVVDLIQFAHHLMQILNFAIRNRVFSLHYDWYHTGVADFSLTFRRTLTFQFNPKILNFDLLFQMTLFQSSIVQSLPSYAH